MEFEPSTIPLNIHISYLNFPYSFDIGNFVFLITQCQKVKYRVPNRKLQKEPTCIDFS